jgi:hypothetical protein
MTNEEFIIQLFCQVDDEMVEVGKHSQAKLYPSEVVTIGLLYSLRGGYFRTFYRWLKDNYESLFAGLPERTRLQRQLATHQDWCERFLAAPTFFTVMDSYGVELCHPAREGRNKRALGKKGKSNRRWIVGVKLCWLVNSRGQVVAWDWNTANVHDQQFRPLAHQFDEVTITLCDLGFAKAGEANRNLKLCAHKTWSERMLIETLFSALTRVCRCKHLFHRVERYLTAHFAFVAALFNVLHSLDPQHAAHLAQFAL